jgi:hypothetical protein
MGSIGARIVGDCQDFLQQDSLRRRWELVSPRSQSSQRKQKSPYCYQTLRILFVYLLALRQILVERNFPVRQSGFQGPEGAKDGTAVIGVTTRSTPAHVKRVRRGLFPVERRILAGHLPFGRLPRLVLLLFGGIPNSPHFVNVVQKRC